MGRHLAISMRPCCVSILISCRELGRLLRVNVMGYDYTGYGVCTGQPSIAATCCDISAVLQSLEVDHGVKRHHVVLYGQSVGSGPTVRQCIGVQKFSGRAGKFA